MNASELNILFFKMSEALYRQGITIILPYTFIDGQNLKLQELVGNIKAISQGMEEL